MHSFRRLTVHPLEPRIRDNVRLIFHRARDNNNPPRAVLQEVFGREFARSFTYALEILRATGDKRESGHASIVHSLEVATSLAGWGNTYGFQNGFGIAGLPSTRIVTPYDLAGLKGEDYLVKAMCVGILHDVVEDAARNVDDLERGFERLWQALSEFGRPFATVVTQKVRLLTNRYARVLKVARKNMHENGEDPLESVQRGLEKTRADLAAANLRRYVQLADMLILDVQRLIEMQVDITGDPMSPRAQRYFYTHIASVNAIVEYLSFRAYNHFTRDLLHACVQEFKSDADDSDIPLLVKGRDGTNNVETMNLSVRTKIRRALAKAEIVGRRMNSEEKPSAEPDIAWIKDETKGWLQFLNDRPDVREEYRGIWEAMAIELRCLIVRACVIRRIALQTMDADSMAGEMGPFLERLELKYRTKYGIPESRGEIRIVQHNPVGGFWYRDRPEI